MRSWSNLTWHFHTTPTPPRQSVGCVGLCRQHWCDKSWTSTNGDRGISRAHASRPYYSVPRRWRLKKKNGGRNRNQNTEDTLNTSIAAPPSLFRGPKLVLFHPLQFKKLNWIHFFSSIKPALRILCSVAADGRGEDVMSDEICHRCNGKQQRRRSGRNVQLPDWVVNGRKNVAE